MSMYEDICTEIMHQQEAGENFDDLRLIIHPDRLNDLMIEMSANSHLLDQSKGRPTRFGQVPISETVAQEGWRITSDKDEKGPLAEYDPWFHRKRCESGDGDPQNMECMVCGAAFGEACRDRD